MQDATFSLYTFEFGNKIIMKKTNAISVFQQFYYRGLYPSPAVTRELDLYLGLHKSDKCKYVWSFNVGYKHQVIDSKGVIVQYPIIQLF